MITSSSQPTDLEAVRLAEHQWNEAILLRNVDAASAFMDPGYRLVIGVTGQPLRIVPLDAWLATLPNYRIHEHHTDDMHISLFGDFAVCTLSHRQIADPVQGRDISGHFLITDIWVRRGNNWLVAERHSSRLEPAPTAA